MGFPETGFPAGLRRAWDWVKGLRLTGERRALSLLPLMMFGLLYLAAAVTAEPGWGPALGALSISYFVAFFAIASGWFWARWYASGLGWSGLSVGLMALVLIGWHPALALYAGLHGLVVVMLMGANMAALFELREGWRERYSMDEFGVTRLGKAVTRGSGALPTLILWALAPREQAAALGVLDSGLSVMLLGGLGLLCLALYGFAKLRGFAVLALGGAALLLVAGAALSSSVVGWGWGLGSLGWSWPAPFTPAPVPALTALLVAAAFLPFAGPLARYLRGRR